MAASKNLSPKQRILRARAAVYTSWANTEDRTARTEPGRQAQWKRFEDQVDPDRKLTPEERFKRAKAAQSAHMASLSLKRSKKAS